MIIDLRPASPTFRQHFGVRLEPSDDRMLYVPEGFAHGFLTLEDDTAVFYQMSQTYAALACRRRALERSGLRDRLAVRADRSWRSATGPTRTFAHRR